MRQSGVGRPHAAPMVDAHHVLVPAEFVCCHLLQKRLRGDTGIVDQRIDTAKSGHSLRNERRAILSHAHIGAHAQSLRAERLAFARHGLQGF